LHTTLSEKLFLKRVDDMIGPVDRVEEGIGSGGSFSLLKSIPQALNRRRIPESLQERRP
jgi:hypothetical protein